MVEVQKKENESTASLIRRFSHKLQQAGNLNKARARQYKKRPKSKLSKKKSAIYRVEKRKKIEKLKKLGKIEQR